MGEIAGIIAAGVAVAAAAITIAVKSKSWFQTEEKEPPYDSDGFDTNGFDIAGQDKAYYQNELAGLNSKLKAIKKRMDSDAPEYALLDIRKALEASVKLYVMHWNGSVANAKLADLINDCPSLSPDMISKLHSARKHCNDALHDSGEKKTFNQVYFCYKTLEEMLGEIRGFAE